MYIRLFYLWKMMEGTGLGCEKNIIKFVNEMQMQSLH